MNKANDYCSGYQAKATGLTAAMPRGEKSLTDGKGGGLQGGRVVTDWAGLGLGLWLI